MSSNSVAQIAFAAFGSCYNAVSLNQRIQHTLPVNDDSHDHERRSREIEFDPTLASRTRISQSGDYRYG